MTTAEPKSLVDQAWDMMLLAENPMLPHAALDWLREKSDDDETIVIKGVLYLWAGNRLGELGDTLGVHHWLEPEPLPNSLNGTKTGRGCWRLMEGKLDEAWNSVSWILKANHGSSYVQFARQFKRYVDLCRALEELP